VIVSPVYQVARKLLAFPALLLRLPIAACQAAYLYSSIRPPRTRVRRSEEAGIDPAPERNSSTWASFLRSQAEALLACDFMETVTLSGVRMYVLVVIEHGSRRIGPRRPRLPDTIHDPGPGREVPRTVRCRPQGRRNRRRAQRHPDAKDELDHGKVEQTSRRELLDRTLIWNQRHLLHTLREFEQVYNRHRPHQGIANARPLHPLPPPIDDADTLARLGIRRHHRLGGILHEYRHAA